MYEFVTGPLAWFSFAIFFVGIIVRAVLHFKGSDGNAGGDTHIKKFGDLVMGSFKVILSWLFPFAARRWWTHLGAAILVFVFRIGLVGTPIFLLAHNILLKERWGLRFWALSETTADVLTVAVIVSALFLVLRCIALPQLRITTTAYDYLFLAVLIAPFVTGFLAYHQVPNYRFWLIAHIICAEVLLVTIPFTKFIPSRLI